MMTGAALAPFANCTNMKKSEEQKIKNWAGNLTYSTTNVLRPSTIEEVKEIVKESNKIKVLGTRHCFNRIADSDEKLLSTENLK